MVQPCEKVFRVVVQMFCRPPRQLRVCGERGGHEYARRAAKRATDTSTIESVSSSFSLYRAF